MKGFSVENVDELREFFRDSIICDLYTDGLRDHHVGRLLKRLEAELFRIQNTPPQRQRDEILKLARQVMGDSTLGGTR